MGDPLQNLLPDDAAARVNRGEVMPFVDWMNEVGFALDGQVFDLERTPNMRELYFDNHPNITIRKGSQTGASYMSLGKMLWSADQLGMRWIYFLPTKDEARDFVKDRVDGLFNENAYLKSLIGDTDTPGLKRFSGTVIYFRGLWNMRDAKSVPADGLIFDELDELDPLNHLAAQDRVLASKFQWRLQLSVPSFSDYGIDALFKQTDQHFYQVKCPSCGHWNRIDQDFPANFLPIARSQRKSWPEKTTHYRGCTRCGAHLDMHQGQWVAEYPDRDLRGYHVSRLCNMIHDPLYPNVATHIMKEYDKALGSSRAMRRFKFAFLGVPDDGEGAKITDELLDSLEGDHGFLYKGVNCIFGGDQGDTLDYQFHERVGDKLRMIYCGSTDDWDVIDKKCQDYGLWAGGMDGMPNRYPAKGWATKWKERNAFIQDFAGESLQEKDSVYKGQDTCRRVTVDRTDSLDATVEFLQKRMLILPNKRRLSGQELKDYEKFRREVKNLKWREKEDAKGRTVREYLRSKEVPNHHGMALNSARIAAFELGIEPPPTGVGPVFLGWYEGTA